MALPIICSEKKMLPAGVKYFWEDLVCKYWKWAGKVGGSEMNMKPALSVMHAKAHKWSCQVLYVPSIFIWTRVLFCHALKCCNST